LTRHLLYAPDLVGHPQVYLRVISRALIDAGAEVVIASPSDAEHWKDEWPLVAPFLSEPGLKNIDLRNETSWDGQGVDIETLVDIQRRELIDSTLFLETDKSAEQLLRIVRGEAPRLRGKNHAIFANTTWWEPGEDPYTGHRDPARSPGAISWIRRVKRKWTLDLLDARNVIDAVIEKEVFDTILVKDERAAAARGKPVVWMPEIYRVFDDEEAPEDGADYLKHSGPISDFVVRHGADRVVLFFGAGAWYKGYDRFIRLIASDESLAGLHVGAGIKREAHKAFEIEPEDYLPDLRASGRLYETNAFVESTALIDLAFKSVSKFISTHRLVLSSGTCLQALDYGKPILTPDAGLVGWRTRTAGIGATYDHNDASGTSLLQATQRFLRGENEIHTDRIESFMKQFSRETVESFFVKLMLN
jgi:hypothetical protein